MLPGLYCLLAVARVHVMSDALISKGTNASPTQHGFLSRLGLPTSWGADQPLSC
jgi:hypothetical protein